jgi:ABC-type transporter Mla maintaining outer membrane lipid asymmetry ATPase subunit MlaF
MKIYNWPDASAASRATFWSLRSTGFCASSRSGTTAIPRKIPVLDEPLPGLNVSTTPALRDLLAELAAAGRMIVYSSHVLDVLENVCSRVLTLNKGRVVALQ